MWRSFVVSTAITLNVLVVLWGIISAGLAVYFAQKLSVNVDLLSASVHYAAEEPEIKSSSHR